MKNMKNLLNWPTLRGLVIGLAALALSSYLAKASPYASGVTNDSGTIWFVMNEAGATVTVTYEDASTYPMGVLPKGATNFPLGLHTSYKISCVKQGNGTPALISSDSFSNSIWANPRGVSVNQNPKRGDLFGRIYAGSGGTGGYGPGTPGYKAQGIYAMNADQTMALGKGTNAYGSATFALSGTSGPWRMRVAPDNTLLVDDYSTAAAALWQFQPDLSDSNLVLAIVGQTAAAAAGIHGDFFGTPLMTGSLAAGNLVLWTADPGMAVPAGTTTGPGTSIGSYNCLFRYDIGSGPLPWNNKPNYAYTVGLDGIAELRPEVDIGKDGKIIAGFGRANLSNPDIQILSPDGTTLLYTSGNNPPANFPPPSDPWNGINGSGSQVGTYAGVRVSPDGRYLASVDINNGITIATLVGGIPDDTSIFGIINTPATGNSRGMDWDAANNLYVCSSGQGLLRVYSLGITTTCVTSNDWSGTNGSFQMVVPNVTATVVATQPNASQNYINSTPAGTPIPGVFRITLSTNQLDGPITVNFSRTGTASYTTNVALTTYSINTTETPNGVIIGTNTVTFPSGNMPGGGNWYVDVKITPTAYPVSTNTLTVIMQISGGSTYLAGTPSRGTVSILNTGPQLLLLTAAPTTTTVFGGGTMYRGVTNDYAKFVITRLGDTNGPGNSPGNISPTAYTITNVTYLSNATTAVFGRDYTARAQRADPAGDGIIQPPVDGPTAIVVYPGDTAVTCVLGNPVPHTNLGLAPTNLSIIVNMTNAVTGITNTTAEGFQYTVGTATVTLTELDNAIGPETVLWSNSLTSASDSVNWTLTFGATNFGPGSLPVVIPSYVNDATSIVGGGTNDFLARFGNPVLSDGVSPSPVMAANGWTTALKMTVNKNNSAQAGVNVYPRGQKFNGNYALRFNMYLSLYDYAINNPNIGSAGREYALFGVNHIGNNCNWRTDAAMVVGSGMIPTNSDGQWFAIDAGAGGITPADFDCMTPGPVPNNANSGGTGGLNDKQSNSAASQNGVFKHPPFDCMNTTDYTRTIAAPGGGEPADKWVDVSVEITRQTNINCFINKSLVIPAVALTNGSLATSYTNGTIMFGYDDPNANVSDSTAFVYFSNVRVVELSPYIVVQPGMTNSLATSLIRIQGDSLTLTSSVTFATAPITNVWYRGTGTAGSPNTGIPTAAMQTNSVNATSMSDSLPLNNLQAINATNYMAVFSDAAGSVTSTVVAVEVVLTPVNQVFLVGSTNQLQVRVAGPIAPTSYQWQTNKVNLANSTHYAGVTSTNLSLTNITLLDGGIYGLTVLHPAGTVTQFVTLTAVGAVVPANTTNYWGASPTFTVTATGSAPTYQWKKNGVDIPGATTSSLTIANCTTNDAATYTVGVTNGTGVLSSAGVLKVLPPQPTFTPGGASVVGLNMVLSFSSLNTADTTSEFILQSAGVVTGPYTNDPSASFTTSGPGLFQVTVPQTGNGMFYRLVHVNY